MIAHGYDCATPAGDEPAMVADPAINLNSGYIRRGIELLPKQGSAAPWRFNQNYLLDLRDLKFGAVDDGTMEFTRVANGRRMERRGDGAPSRP
jgi:hypothetical protein